MLYVLTSNDYPKGVYSTYDKAETKMNKLKARDEKYKGGGIRPTIYYNIHQFKLDE